MYKRNLKRRSVMVDSPETISQNMFWCYHITFLEFCMKTPSSRIFFLGRRLKSISIPLPLLLPTIRIYAFLVT